jgi:hypothetical protein
VERSGGRCFCAITSMIASVDEIFNPIHRVRLTE